MEQFAFLFIQGGKRSAFGHGPDNDFLSRDPVRIEGMKGLPGFMQHKIGNVHHIVNGCLADGP